jgi:Leucine-rich repeat (LRR) protein
VRAEKLAPRLGLDEAVYLKCEPLIRCFFSLPARPPRSMSLAPRRYMSPQAKSASEVVNVRERAKGKSRRGNRLVRCCICLVTHRRVIALIVGKLQWEEHMEQVQAMQSCNLSHSDVFSCGDSSWLRQRLVNLNELILSSVLITTWSTVAAIISALPTLETLDVSNNLLQLTDADRDERQPVLSASLAQIILNATVSAIVRLMWHTSCNALWQGMSWPDAQFLPAAFPRLQRLHLSRNSISSLSLASGSVQRWFGLQLLIVENNVIESWSDVAHLAPLPSLVRLSLCGNPVAGAHVPTPLCT